MPTLFYKSQATAIGVSSRVFTAILRKEEEMYVAECPEVGVVSQGEDVDKAVANLKEAVELYLEEFPQKKI